MLVDHCESQSPKRPKVPAAATAQEMLEGLTPAQRAVLEPPYAGDLCLFECSPAAVPRCAQYTAPLSRELYYSDLVNTHTHTCLLLFHKY